ncbi:error-prone DNA polymerase [Elioraea sp.]|uniref:error-prone DNA polymerase n=1 Tax=Elioraea sp. TaxID=2185103 RepID=UPI003F72CA68
MTPDPRPAYAELQAVSNFSFLEGASHADELVLTARALGLSALAITDRNSVAGLVRGHLAAKAHGLRFLPATRLDLTDGASFLCYPTDRAAWGRLCRLLSHGRMNAPKGECRIGREHLLAHADGQVLVALPPGTPDAAFRERLRADAMALSGRTALPLHLGASVLHHGDDQRRLDVLAALACACGTPLVTLGDVRFHAPARHRLADVLSAIRLRCAIDALGLAAEANAERHLKPPEEIARLFARHPEAVARTLDIVRACRFSLDELRYEYPDEITEPGHTPQQTLIARTWQGAAERWPGGIPAEVRARIEHELALIERLGYAPYFLTVHEIVRFARERGILCQGRGSAANSAVCYALGITAVDPAKHDLLFERFVSAARNEPPDIDVDFEHERREEVIQWIYARYSRERAALAATVIHWRHRMAIREVGRTMGLSEDVTGRIAGETWGPGREGSLADRVVALGLDRTDARLMMTLELAEELVGFPRHLSQHVGGFVITRGPLVELCPVANAAMAERTTIEWDKDDIDALGILKVDVLALGMLTCIRKAFDLIATHHGRRCTLATVPPEDQAIYAMLSRADSLGVFQVESRAQMAMLPRLRPSTFYDLVIEVAIVRPGPIQGDMVHPYLRRRNGEEAVTFPSPELEAVLGRTLGVPLFQEQAMKIAIVAAGFTPDEADRLRRAMATFRNVGTIHTFREKLIEGMAARGYDRGFAERCFRQIEGFGTYGFPESHAASFALLVYVSAWIKCRYPTVFAAALLNSQPMGFYAPAQIVRDARNHGVVVQPPDVNASLWDCTLEPCAESAGGVALRLGLREVKGLRTDEAAALVAARAAGNARPFETVEEVARRARLGPAPLERLAEADGFAALGLSRREALWQARAIEGPAPLLAAAEGDLFAETEPTLPVMTLGEQVVADYASLALSLKAHPMALLRPEIAALGCTDTRALLAARPGSRVRLAGLVLVRQRPGSAKGVVFVTIEDEHGHANLVVMPDVLRRFRSAILGARLMVVDGVIERQDYGAAPIIHVRARRIENHTPLLATLHEKGWAEAAWDGAIARADEVRRPAHNDPRVTPPKRPRLGPAPGRFLPDSRDFH